MRGTAVTMDLDWRQTGKQTWDIVIETDAGLLTLSDGGAVLAIGGETRGGEDREYAELYRGFAALVGAGEREVDLAPFRLVADAFLRGQRQMVAPFDD